MMIVLAMVAIFALTVTSTVLVILVEQRDAYRQDEAGFGDPRHVG